MYRVLRFFKRLYDYRSVIMTMTVQEIRHRYAGTLAGSIWAVINPLMLILVYWFVFSAGLRVRPTGGVPFIVFFSVGLIPWITFSETLTSSAICITSNAHLVKRMVFPTEILSVVTLLANLITHVVMVVIVGLIILLSGFGLSLINLQFFYYLFALSVFCVGLSWFFSALNVFHRDTGLVLAVLLNVWFWLTPIVYGIEMLPERFHYYMKLNPVFYVVDGYRYSFIYHRPFWENYRTGLYFWGVSVVLFLVGGFIFSRLKPEFPEVL